MIKIKFIPSNANSPTQVYNTINSNKYRLSIKCGSTERRIYYYGFLTDSNEKIFFSDWCFIINPYEGEEYYEQCQKVTVENNREIFYGMEGTRCLLIDALKITGTTDTLLKEVIQIIVTDEILKEYYCKTLSFMEEDLLG